MAFNCCYSFVCVILFSVSFEAFGNEDAFKLVTRAQWNALPPKADLTELQLPMGKVIIAHTASKSCSTQETCSAQARNIQSYHMNSRNWDDIGYNFLVGGDGAIYEGRGWTKQGAHTKGYNNVSICVTFIGTYTTTAASAAQIKATQDLIQSGVDGGYLSGDYKLYGHRQLVPTESPGQKLYEEIQTWAHWSSTL